MSIDLNKWESGCCALTYEGKDAAGNTVLLTRAHGAEVTRVEVYGPDNRQIGELREVTNTEAEALIA